jgi:glycosyltransferase involved in cell wall biosynthesis
MVEKKNIYVVGRIKNPTTYVIDRIRRRVSLALKDEINFYSLDDGIFPKKVQILHSKLWPIGLWGYRAFKLRNPKMKHITTFYGLFSDDKTVKKYIRVSDIITTVSLTTKLQAYQKFGDADYRVIYDGVDAEFYKPDENKIQNTKTRILMNISGIRNIKNHRTFLQMAKKFPEAEFIFHTFSKVDNKLKNVTIDNIKYPVSNDMGDCEGLKNMYNSADIYFYPSIQEGLNNTMLEAMACGLPLIAFDTTSMPELIEDGKNGFLCQNHRDMEEKLSYLIQHQQARETMGKRSREIAKWYTWKRCIQGYKEVYDELSQ